MDEDPPVAAPEPAVALASAGSADSGLSPLGDNGRRSFRQEVLKLLLITGAGLFTGAAFGVPALGLCASLVVYVGGQLRMLRTLRLWLDTPKAIDLPEPSGIWGEVFESLLDLQRRNRKRKKKLAAIVAEFQASTAALPDGAVVLGEQGDIVWFNKAAQALLGLHASQDLGIRIANLMRHPAFGEYLAAGEYDRTVEVPSPVNINVMLALRIIPYGNNQRLLIVRDVSEIRRLETARRDFVANASHELRTPLTVLRGYLDMLEPETRGSGSLAAWKMPVVEMKTQAARMESLIHDMLKLAKLESDVYESKQDVLDVPLILAQVIEEARSLSRGQHRFELAIEPDVCLYGRESEARSIFSNLVGNAIRYTPDQGVIQVSWKGDADGAHFAVADTGIGISDKDIPRLTERFYRVDVGRSRAQGGTGLGLSIVKHALERHEGRLVVESELGVGSTFTCHFPIHRVHRRTEYRERSPTA